MNAHNKTQFTFQRSIVHSKIQVVTHQYQRILCSQYLTQMQVQAQLKCNAHTHKDENNACFHPKVCPYFPIDICFSFLKIKKVFARLVMGLSTK
ncbi:hypothetical protein H5410_005044, partial [Solanum commersonii]